MNAITRITTTGMTLLAFFIISVISGIILHLKKHGMIVEPRAVIKMIHWISAYLMVLTAIIHSRQFWIPFLNHLGKHDCKGFNMCALIILIMAATITGAVKQFSPVKIHGLGLWHYWIGMLMSLSAIVHLVRGVPMLFKLIRATRYKQTPANRQSETCQN